MDSDNRLKLIAAGLILAAFAVVYFIFAQRFASNKTPKTNLPQPITQVSPTPFPTPTPFPSGLYSTPTPTPNVLSDTTKGGQPLTKGGIQQLPATGVPTSLMAIFSVSAIIGGYFLRRFPK